MGKTLPESFDYLGFTADRSLALLAELLWYKENTSFKAIMIDEDLQSTMPHTSPHTTVRTCRTGIRSLPPALEPLPVMFRFWERNWVAVLVQYD